MLRPGKHANGNDLPSYGGGSAPSSGGYAGSYGGYNGGGGYSNGGGAYSNGGGAYHGGFSGSTPQMAGRKGPPPSPFRSKWVWAILGLIALLGTTLHFRSKFYSVLKELHVKTLEDVVNMRTSWERERKRLKKESQNNRQEMKDYQHKVRELEMDYKKLEKERDLLQERGNNNDGNNDARVKKLEQENKKLKKERDNLKNANPDAAKDKETINKLQKDITKLKKDRDSLRKQVNGNTDAKKIQREEGMSQQLEWLQNYTRKEAKRAVLERFGPGPHRVKFQVELPDNDYSTVEEFVVELAPLDLVPHAIHVFLEQVQHELWDETYIYLNGPHVIQAGPQDYTDDVEEGAALQPFIDTSLDKLAFPDYHDDFPHSQYTLGFTGRPGGPDWYINKGDNRRAHGPGGQPHHALPDQADSCFGKVVEGQDLMKRIFDLPTYTRGHEYAYYYKEPVEIYTVRLESKATPEDETKAAREAAAKRHRDANHQHGKPLKIQHVDEEE